MLNAGSIIDSADVKTIDGMELYGTVNVTDDALLENVRSAIRRGHPQFHPKAANYERIALVGGGPSLEATLPDIVELVHEGAKVVTLNGAYHWALERHLHPSIQLVMDARPHNARFVQPFIPRCHYWLASQCAPEVWDAVAEYPEQVHPVTGQHVGGVAIFHAMAEAEGPMRDLLDAYYRKQWFGVFGGTTVAIRAINLLAMAGFCSFDLFGVDSCFMDGKGHAYAQPENDRDRRLPFKVEPAGRPDLAKTFWCAPWHVKQAENLLELIKVNGANFTITVHPVEPCAQQGLLAYMLWAQAQSEDGSVSLIAESA